MNRAETFWLALEKFALFFSFVVNLILVVVVLALVIVLIRFEPTIKNDVAMKLMGDLNTGIDLLGSATITRTIYIEDSIPISFTLPIERDTVVTLNENVPLTARTTVVLPAGGGQLNATVSLNLPKGMPLPVHLTMDVPVSQTVPVVMDVPVEIPLQETDLNKVVVHFQEMLAPYEELIQRLP
ncbi:MAG: hypothetical protein SVX38_09745 [Chloroflexota bacterium]|nr:hypothetical protein [Chloroflexota bacterium]